MSEAITNYILKQNVPGFGYKIFIRNETSHTLFSKPELLHLIELKEKGLLLEIPKNVLQKGHLLTLFFVPIEVELKTRLPDSGPLKEAAFTGMVKVEQVESGKEENDNVTASVAFTQFDTDLWTKILEKFSEKQEATTKKLFSQHLVRDEE